jgi:acetolactate synthase-1/2/3 large subunit
MAEGYARSTGKPGVVLVTSGPGATNMVTALTDALMDSIPLVCITGQVPTSLIGSTPSRNATPSASPGPAPSTTGWSRTSTTLPRVLHEAFYVATTGRPGPVVVDIPKDVQFATGTYTPNRRRNIEELSAQAEGRSREDPRRPSS